MLIDKKLVSHADHIEASGDWGPSTTGYPWFALQVRARHELLVAEYLRGKGYEWFLPLYKCKKRWSDRTKEVESPLFPGYLFCRFDPQWRLPILNTPGVIRVVGNNRQPTPVDDQEIAAIQTLIASGARNQPWPYVEIGDRVRIESGPLRGLEGILLEFRGNQRLVLSITLLQRSMAVELDPASVTPLRSQKTSPVEKVYSRSSAIQPAV